MPRRLILLLVLVILALPATASAAFQNGGFENGPNPPATGTCRNVGSGAASTDRPTGWSNSQSPSSPEWCSIPGVMTGDRYLRFAGSDALFQNVDTAVGTTYLIDFTLLHSPAAAGCSTGTSTFTMASSTAESATFTSSTTKTNRVYAFTALSTTSQVIISVNNSESGGCGTYLDDVTVTPLDCSAARVILDGDAEDTAAAAGVIAGSGADDIICGSATADTLQGGAGNDALVGGAGQDQLSGEGDNDFLLGGNDGDVINGGAGNDRLRGGTDSASDRMIGGTGSDWFDATRSTAVSDPGIDRVDYATDGHASATVTLDNVANDSDSDNVSTEVESITGTSGVDTFTGDAVTGLSGDSHANTFTGGGGADILNGGDGTDFFSGGAGGDTFNGGDGADRVTYRKAGAGAGYAVNGDGIVTANVFADLDGTGDDGVCSAAVTLAAGCTGTSEGDNVMPDVEYLFGGTGNDVFDMRGYTQGAPAAGIVASGYDGDDTLIGTTGNDFFEGGVGSDTACGRGGSDIFFTIESTNPATCP